MPEKRRFSIVALVVTLLVIAALIGTIYFLLPDAFLTQAPLIIGAALVAALVLWGILHWQAGKAIGEAIDNARIAEAQVSAPQPAIVAAPEPEPEPVKPPLAPIIERDEMPAVQLLAILQRKGRLVDFLQEDLSQFADDQIGAAVRTIHEGCRAALDETMDLEPVLDDPEGASVTLERGFDANRVRLSGVVSGEPPFRGVVRHRGWIVNKIDLPKRTKGSGDEMIVAAAEVEVGG